MTNENKNINELVADDDPTAELEMPLFEQDIAASPEADAKTYADEDSANNESSPGVTVSELQSDLRSRRKTISKLQHDIQQLRSRWPGLETEISARESQTAQLNTELSSSREVIVRKEKLLKKRDQTIKSLKAEIRQRDNEYRQLEGRVDESRVSAAHESPLTQHDEQPMQQQLGRTEEYADSLRRKLQDLIDSTSCNEREIDSFSQRLDHATMENAQLSDQMTRSATRVEELQSELADIQGRHEEEIRLLRFDLTTAEETVVETEDLSSQLASDLVDARDFKEELERMLGDVEEQSTKRIEALQKEVTKLHRKTDRYEQKLTTKSEAISVLLAELAQKSEQLESIGEIGDVIHEIDERMSERSFKNGQDEHRAPADRVTRVLVGAIDDQVLQFPLFKDRLTIGRTKDNDIQLKAGSVSRRHAVIQTDGGVTRIIDWGSKNGIQVNSAKVSEHFLCHGDIVMIGSARFRYEERKKRDA